MENVCAKTPLMSGQVREEETQSALPHFARAAAWAGGAFALALGTGMAPLLFPHDGGYVLLGMLVTIPATVTSINLAALNYGQGTACRYAAKGITFKLPEEPPAPKI